MKALLVIGLIVLTVFCLSFSRNRNNAYNNLFTQQVQDFQSEQAILIDVINASDPSSPKGARDILNEIEKARIKLKNIDFWIRYFEPNAYRKINGPLPVEWENEVFEKFEPPYRREGAGLSLTEIAIGEPPVIKDSLLALMRRSELAVKTYQADSITSQLNSYNHFFLANRLFLLNLSAIYTTGFECPDTSKVVPELLSMLEGTKEIYDKFNEGFAETRLSADYLEMFQKTIRFVQQQSVSFSDFDQFDFIRNYVNPLFAMNQHFINTYSVRSINYNDYTLNNKVESIFDKGLYASQNTKGVYSMVEDSATLDQIRYVGKLLFYDPVLSGNNKRSCASCHKPTEYFTDTSVATAFQFEQKDHLARNTPTLINSLYNHLLMLDGKHISLQGQGKDVMTSHAEMNSSDKELLKKVLSCKQYKEAFKSFLKLTPEEKEISMDHIASAITFYDGSFSRYYSPFDEAMNKKDPVSDDVKKGFNLFMTRAKCGTCHFVPNFNGVKPPFIGSEFEVLGTPSDTTFKSISPDLGRYNVNKAPETLHAFRTGSIRNAKFTKPYMHNGVFTTLDEVIDFYDVGGGLGKKLDVVNQTLPPDSLKLSATDKRQLLAFIYSLNEKIVFEEAPASLPASTDKALNKRKVGGEY